MTFVGRRVVASVSSTMTAFGFTASTAIPTRTFRCQMAVNETREYRTWGYRSEMGRSSVQAECPWCKKTVTLYVWSLPNGKRCFCGVIFHPGEAMDDKGVHESDDFFNKGD